MNRIITVAAIAIVAGFSVLQSASAGLVGMPISLRSALRIKFETPTLPPMAYTMFCLHYSSECRQAPIFRGGPVSLTEARWADLTEVNQAVNRSIAPERNELGLVGESWVINPDRGDCNDYAVSKRHELLKRGWPARVLLLSEVVVNSGEHHLILVVRTKSGDLVLDNMTPQIKPWSRVPYRWVRIQMPNKPKYWSTVASRVYQARG
ncbi:transglutaminase-like cysteine peptidase [Bradyrhizobium jicamae]|uniref:Transglutaminase-like cysteine peptidase n=1 Tax=Bradyrhizobium jicamae TaxID=280332 RepID=A0ABS5FLB5_9BRAD|nr:transglutaminase-like cysteine peptidase [Bradyrhizobium jicamae]MBR0797176.1 transglutaminase-like cysteine peptidase [Bradyrhizobium jicamae]MBR0934911.1 transglutaminase-like cysteine peptidase [Bradyrhizobium jicamae]